MHRAPLVFPFLLVLLSALTVAQTAPQNKGGGIMVYQPPDHPGPPFGTELRKVPLLIQLACKDNADEKKLWSVSGTAFLVGYKDSRLPSGQQFDYLVTNRHVAECWDEKNKPREVLSIDLKANTKNGPSSPIMLNQHGNFTWFFSDDNSVDLAVTIIQPPDNLDLRMITLDTFLTKAEFDTQRVSEGTTIIFAGYSYHLEGSTRIQPLVREGILSMIPDEPLLTTTKKSGTAYLGDVHTFGGNSGSPVFVNLNGFRPDGRIVNEDYRFLGVVSGYYYEDSDFNLQIETTITATQHANSGISMIVPADCLKDLILNNVALKSMRDKYFASLVPK